VGVLGIGCTQPAPDSDASSAPQVGTDVLTLDVSAHGPSCPGAELACQHVAVSGQDAGTPEAHSCCESLWVPGGAFEMGYSEEEVADGAALAAFDRDHTVRINGYYLDRFEVTRARFMHFAQAYTPFLAQDRGAHPRIEGSGWQEEWNRYLPPDSAALLDQVFAEGTDTLGSRDADTPVALETVALDEPVGRLSWFVAFAFCAWDGGRLPTEAEWEFAAAGGIEDRVYPWGNDAAHVATLREAEPSFVGVDARGRARFGHDDLAGSLREWVFDWAGELFYAEEGFGCVNCANLTPDIGRAVRGARDPSCCGAEDTEFRAAARHLEAPAVVLPELGARCARDR
jgi:formylglycine-generating enzyme required for sulfatase activity